jgi:hypothetical protein
MSLYNHFFSIRAFDISITTPLVMRVEKSQKLNPISSVDKNCGKISPKPMDKKVTEGVF